MVNSNRDYNDSCLTTGRVGMCPSTLQSELSLGLMNVEPDPNKRVRKINSEALFKNEKLSEFEEMYATAFMTLKEIAGINDSQSVA